MLNPFEYSIITLEEAKKLVQFIEKTTSTPSLSKNYLKMQELGILSIYDELRMFINNCNHYEDYLRYFDSKDYKRSDEE